MIKNFHFSVAVVFTRTYENYLIILTLSRIIRNFLPKVLDPRAHISMNILEH